MLLPPQNKHHEKFLFPVKAAFHRLEDVSAVVRLPIASRRPRRGHDVLLRELVVVSLPFGPILLHQRFIGRAYIAGVHPHGRVLARARGAAQRSRPFRHRINGRHPAIHSELLRPRRLRVALQAIRKKPLTLLHGHRRLQERSTGFGAIRGRGQKQPRMDSRLLRPLEFSGDGLSYLLRADLRLLDSDSESRRGHRLGLCQRDRRLLPLLSGLGLCHRPPVDELPPNSSR